MEIPDSETASGTKGKILVVEDSDDTREMMAKLLELESFTVVTARNGRVGLDLAESENPDLIITDINMPDLNGLEMIRQIRSRPELENVPIMAITALGSSMAREAIEAGANRASIKPIEFDLLVSGITQLLEDT